MPLFTRRTLQRLILENAAFTTMLQRRRHADAINRGGPGSLADEWEIAVLNGLWKFANVDHEPVCGDKRPDVLAFTKSRTPSPLFLADIATVFETGREEANPVHALKDMLIKRARSLGVRANGLRLQVEGELDGMGKDSVMRLKLPSVGEFHQLFAEEITPFLRRCTSEPAAPHALVIRDGGLDFTITYDPAQQFFGSGHPAHTTTYSLTRNPVANTLKRKLRQLRTASAALGLPDLPLGVILCAADADLRPRTGMSGISTEEIVQTFMRQNRSLDFVLTLWASDSWTRQPGAMHSYLHLNAAASQPLRAEAEVPLRGLQGVLPPPAHGGVNALNVLKSARYRRGSIFYGGWSVSDNDVKISARNLMELLAGRIALDLFLDRHGRDQQLVPLFEQKLRQGRLLTEAVVERVPDKDDDWIIFRFGAPDPAVGPLRPE